VGPSTVELVRVFARETNAVIAEVTFPYDISFEAVIECRAGYAIHALGARYEIKIDIIDFSAMAPIVSSAIVAAGFMEDTGWSGYAQQFVFSIPEPGASNEGHIWKIFASLKVGVISPYVSLAESDLLLITSR